MNPIICTTLFFALLVLPGSDFLVAGSLRGTVRDAISLDPIPGVNVTVHVLIPDSIPFPAVTDSSGDYDITGIIPGNEIYAIVAGDAAHVRFYARVDDLGSQDLDYDIFLEPNPVPPPGGGEDSSNVAGPVMAPIGSGGSLIGIAGATVSLSSAGMQKTLTTDSQGKFSARVLHGEYAMIVDAAGYRPLQLNGISVDVNGATIGAVLQSTAVGVDDTQPGTPRRFFLYPLYPSPFNPATTVQYELTKESFVSLRVYDITGREVRNLLERQESPGLHSVEFEATGLASGTYIVRLHVLDTAGRSVYVQDARALLIR